MFRSLKRILKIHREARALDRVPSIRCHAASLQAAEEVDLEEAFRSDEIEAAWNAVAPALQAFDIPDGTGGVNPGDRRAIFGLVRYFQPRTVLEVGTHIGASTVHIAAAMSDRDGSLISVDAVDVNDPIARPWLRHGTTISPADMIRRLAFDRFTQFATISSLDYLRDGERGLDFVFLDGDHTAQTVYREIPAALRLLNTDGVILLHDYFPGAKPLWSDGAVTPGPFLATERLRAEGAGFEVLPLGRLPWPTKRGSNVTSLALLVRSGPAPQQGDAPGDARADMPGS